MKNLVQMSQDKLPYTGHLKHICGENIQIYLKSFHQDKCTVHFNKGASKISPAQGQCIFVVHD